MDIISRQSRCKERQTWIDVGKFFAIVAVMIDHTKDRLYTNENIAYLSYYSVSLFILLMGVNLYHSYKRSGIYLYEKVKNKIIGIVKPYVIATFIYHVVMQHFFHLEQFVYDLIHCSAMGPFYYVSLYVQLLVISPLIFRAFINDTRNKGFIQEVFGLVFVGFISYLTTNYSNILSIYGGGGRLFGGSYLILLYVGMLFGKYSNCYVIRKKGLIAGIIISITATVGWWRFISRDRLLLDSKLPFGSGFNPPSISFSLYGFLMLVTIWLIGKLLDVCTEGIVHIIWRKMGEIGKHTLYIFLYHRLYLQAMFPFLKDVYGIELDNIWFKRLAYFVVIIVGSIIIECIVEKSLKYCVGVYKSK